MKISLVKYMPKSIEKKEVFVGLPGEKLPIGRKIKYFNGEISSIIIRNIKDIENPKLKILKALSKRDMNLEELNKETKLSYENLR